MTWPLAVSRLSVPNKGSVPRCGGEMGTTRLLDLCLNSGMITSQSSPLNCFGPKYAHFRLSANTTRFGLTGKSAYLIY
jgi:hypothetical protein